MRVTIGDGCIRCALCEDLVPDVFRFDAKTDVVVVKYDVLPEEREDEVRQMAADCAVQAIELAG